MVAGAGVTLAVVLLLGRARRADRGRSHCVVRRNGSV